MKRQLLVMSLLVAACGTATAQEELNITKSSKEFVDAFEKEITRLEESGFDKELQSASLGSKSSPEAAALIKKIKLETELVGHAMGDAKVEYDVILQPGHYLRKTGATGAQGPTVSERALVAYIVGEVARDLKAKNLNVLIVSADHYSPNLKAKVFLAVHADGNPKPCATGPSLGYEKNTSMHAMHAIGWGLGQALGYTYTDFMKDNMTVNVARYYMFGRIKTSSVKGLLEIGDLSCAKQEDRMIVNADKIAANVARALRFVIAAP